MKPIVLIFISSLLMFTSCNNNKKTEQMPVEQQTANESKVMLDIFNDIDKTRKVLSQNGIGELHNWKSDQMGGFMSITDYHLIGSSTSNIAYYLESDNANYIKTLKLVLNINNKADKKIAIAKFKELTESTFKSLSLNLPTGLLDAISKVKDFENATDTYTTTLKMDKENIDTYTLTLEAKL